MESYGYSCKRYNFKGGYDLSSRMGTNLLKTEFRLCPPRFTWVSLPCTRISLLQNLCERTELEWCQFEKRVARDMKWADEVAEAIVFALEKRPEADFGWEWPTAASKGWKSKGIQRLMKKMQEVGRPVFWCRFHGCADGLEFNGVPLMKSWTVLTSNRRLWLSLQKICPGHQQHAECHGAAAQASAYHPPKMVQAIVSAISGHWLESDDRLVLPSLPTSSSTSLGCHRT